MSLPKKKPSMVDLEGQLIFYASYHNNPVNIAIHIACIWNILWTFHVFLQYTPELVPAPEWFPPGCKVNVALVSVLFYSLVYLAMEPLIGLIASVLLVLMYYQTSVWVTTSFVAFGVPILTFAIYLHVGCWILQFVGHYVFEGRAPALLDSWDQALITAPMFVLLEMVFFLGYRKEFYRKCMEQVERNIAEFKKEKQK